MRVSGRTQDTTAPDGAVIGRTRACFGRRWSSIIIALTLLLLVLGPIDAGSASATGGFTAVGRPNLNARSGPGTGYVSVGAIGYGAGLDIACQMTGGTDIGGSTIWDKLNAPYAGRWVSDFWVGGTPYARRDPRLPDCNAPTITYASVTTPVASREQRALEWASSQLGSPAYSGWCDKFVANAYGRAASGYYTASYHYADLAGRGLIRNDGLPPAGALVFYGPQPGFGTAGHVTISRGGGSFISPSATVFTYAGVNFFPNYYGWAYANPEWSGR